MSLSVPETKRKIKYTYCKCFCFKNLTTEYKRQSTGFFFNIVCEVLNSQIGSLWSNILKNGILTVIVNKWQTDQKPIPIFFCEQYVLNKCNVKLILCVYLLCCHGDGNLWSRRFPNRPCGRHCGAPSPMENVTRKRTEKTVTNSPNFITCKR